MSSPRQALIQHLRDHAVRTDGPFTLRSGAVSDWYIDARQTTLSGAGARLVGEAVFSRLPPEVDAVGGLTMGADPVAVATAVHAAGKGRELRAFSVRKQEKGHGLEGRLAGPVREGDRVVIVEDTTTTGGAIQEAVDSARAGGLEIAGVFVLVDRSEGVVAERMAGLGLAYQALAEPADLGVGS